jgi:hypothetical protein
MNIKIALEKLGIYTLSLIKLIHHSRRGIRNACPSSSSRLLIVQKKLVRAHYHSFNSAVAVAFLCRRLLPPHVPVDEYCQTGRSETGAG